jgi:hypothetical protein
MLQYIQTVTSWLQIVGLRRANLRYKSPMDTAYLSLVGSRTLANGEHLGW